jgi:hypothetical protein
MKRGISISMVALVLILALASMGLAYTAWTADVHINGSVSTGSLSAILESSSVSLQNGAQLLDPLHNPAGSNQTTCVVGGAESSAMTITASNFYPGIKCVVAVNVKNNGTVPVKIADWQTTGPVSWATATSCQNSYVDAGASVPCIVTVNSPEGQNLSNQEFGFTAVISQWNVQ